MKKKIKKIGQQALPITISASLDEALFLVDLVEKLAYRRKDAGYCKLAMPGDLMALETSSLEANLSGSIHVSVEGDHFSIPYTTCFMFTCTKALCEDYSLSWVSSLS